MSGSPRRLLEPDQIKGPGPVDLAKLSCRFGRVGAPKGGSSREGAMTHALTACLASQEGAHAGMGRAGAGGGGGENFKGTMKKRKE